MNHGSQADHPYRDLVRRTPRTPRSSLAEIERFVAWVASDHSWYKKLPLEPPGEAFFLYLDPHGHKVPRRLAGGEVVWKEIVEFRMPSDQWWVRRFKVEGDPDDREVWGENVRWMSTQEAWDRIGWWTYWNFSRPGQPREPAIEQALAGCTVRDDAGQQLALPRPVLERGLVYLRGTISPLLGPVEEEYEALRRRLKLLGHLEDRARQIREMRDACSQVLAWVYDR